MGDSVVLIVVAARVMHVANRIMSVLKDFPPHRHEGKMILFPNGYGPAAVQRWDE
jgi:hypothetical protein